MSMMDPGRTGRSGSGVREAAAEKFVDDAGGEIGPGTGAAAGAAAWVRAWRKKAARASSTRLAGGGAVSGVEMGGRAMGKPLANRG
jgi:hypothetical protein